MSKTNCVNCGASKDTSEIKCPFCGTTYLDFTAIDFASNDPVVCEFVLPYRMNNARAIMSMVARPYLTEIKQTSEEVTAYSSGGYPLCSFTAQQDMSVGIEFRPVVRKEKELFNIRIDPQQ